MQYLPNTKTLCLEGGEYIGVIAPENTYRSQQQRKNIRVHGRGGNGNSVLIEYESLPDKYKLLVKQHYGDPYTYIARQPLLNLVFPDQAARTYYADYRLNDGRALPADAQAKYVRQAEWLNMIIRVTVDTRTLKDTLNITMKTFWDVVIEVYSADRIKHGLPTSRRRLDEKLGAYKANSYPALVDKKWGNQNTRKVTAPIEELILALYVMRDKPTYTDVCKLYDQFMAGTHQVVNLATGELFNPTDYYTKENKPYEVHPATVKLYINKPANKILVDKFRLSNKEFNDRHRPYMLRKAPFYALSKITMDDTSSPFKQHNGVRPATYKVFDVASQAMIGLVMTKEGRPDAGLIRRLLAEMMGTIVRKGWALPGEIEVEHALNRSLKGKVSNGELVQQDVLSAGTVFPFVHFCAPRNPQEKRAEGFIRGIKDKYQRHREGFQARPFARRDGWRMNEDAAEVTFHFDQIVAMECEDRDLWNAEPHPNQDLYPGLTRWQVLEQCQNPAYQKPSLPLIMPYIGIKNSKPTSLVRGRVMVQGGKYRLPDAYAIQQLNDTKFTAYWLPEQGDEIPTKVYLYQDGQFITEARYESPFQEARAEQTAEDLLIIESQRTYREQFDDMVNTRMAALPMVGVMPVTALIPAQNTPLSASESVEKVQETASNEGGYLQKSEDSEHWFLDPEAIERRALRGI